MADKRCHVVTRRSLLAATGAGLGGVLLAACGQLPAQPPAEKPEAAPKEAPKAEAKPEAKAATPVTLRYYDWMDERMLKQAPDLIFKPFEQAYPNVKIEFIAAPGAIVEYYAKLASLVTAGLSPDTYDESFIMQSVQRGVIQPLDDFIKRDKYDLGQFAPKAVTFLQYQGKQYAIPNYFHGESVALVYNRSLFTAAGVSEPSPSWDKAWTWDEFRQALQKLTKESGGKFTQYGLDPWGLYYFPDIPKAWGGAWISPDFKTITCDRPEVIEAYTATVNLHLKDRTWPTGAEAREQLGQPPAGKNHFMLGKVAITRMGSWELESYRDLKDIDWSFMPYPKPKFNAPQFNGAGKAIAAGAKNPDWGWEFIKFLTAEDRFARLVGSVPARSAGAELFIRNMYKDNPKVRVQVFIDSIPLGGDGGDPIRLVQQWDRMLKEVIQPLWDNMLTGKIDPATGLKNAKGPLQAMLGG
jgi:multiple sugar transport system substrate-binding protein